MSRILVCSEDADLVLRKHKAFQYKTIDLTAIKCGGCFEFEDQGDKLVGVPAELDESEEPIYTVVTKEFGLYAMSNGVDAKLKISFCDDDMMMIDILEGAILIKPDDNVLLASRGVTDLPPLQLDSVLWINCDDVLSYKQYWGTQQERHFQDFEFVIRLRGEIKNGLRSSGCKHIKDETIDISGGAIAVLEEQEQIKEEAKKARLGFKGIITEATGSGYEFDDDDEEEDEDEDEWEDDEVDY